MDGVMNDESVSFLGKSTVLCYTPQSNTAPGTVGTYQYHRLQFISQSGTPARSFVRPSDGVPYDNM